MHQHRLGGDRLESSFTEVALGVLVDHEAATPPCSKGGQQQQHCQKIKEGETSPLFSTSETVSGVGSPVQERYRHTGVSLVKGLEDDKGTGAPHIQGQTVGAGTV